MAGIIAVDTIQNGSGASVPTTTVINGSAKAWVNFNGPNGSATVRGSFNVSSVSFLSQGQWLMNFTSPMPNKNYCLVGSCNQATSGGATVSCFLPVYDSCTTTAAGISASNVSQQLYAMATITAAVFA